MAVLTCNSLYWLVRFWFTLKMVAINKGSLSSKNSKVYSILICKQSKWKIKGIIIILIKIFLIIVNDQSVGSIWLFLMINYEISANYQYFSPWRPPLSLTTDYNFHTGMQIIKRIVELLFSNKPFSDWWLPHISRKHVQPSISYHFFPHITSTRKIANLSTFLNFHFFKNL